MEIYEANRTEKEIQKITINNDPTYKSNFVGFILSTNWIAKIKKLKQQAL